MMGQLSTGQDRLFYSLNFEDHIPKNHLLRSIDQCLDLSDLRDYVADFYCPIGHTLIDPELMIRMLVVGYCYGTRGRLERSVTQDGRRSGAEPTHTLSNPLHSHYPPPTRPPAHTEPPWTSPPSLCSSPPASP